MQLEMHSRPEEDRPPIKVLLAPPLHALQMPPPGGRPTLAAAPAAGLAAPAGGAGRAGLAPGPPPLSTASTVANAKVGVEQAAAAEVAQAAPPAAAKAKPPFPWHCISDVS